MNNKFQISMGILFLVLLSCGKGFVTKEQGDTDFPSQKPAQYKINCDKVLGEGEDPVDPVSFIIESFEYEKVQRGPDGYWINLSDEKIEELKSQVQAGQWTCDYNSYGEKGELIDSGTTTAYVVNGEGKTISSFDLNGTPRVGKGYTPGALEPIPFLQSNLSSKLAIAVPSLELIQVKSPSPSSESKKD